MSNTRREHPQASSEAGARKAAEQRAAEQRAAEQIEHDQDRDPPRTAVPPPGWSPLHKPSGGKG
jgi:hypothetical protein